MADDEADRLVARAIESVLDQVPGAVDTSVPEGAAAKLQPWAETAAPVGRNKRPLEELLAELAERVAADPGARAALPRTRHPALAFFDRFGRGAAGQGRSDSDGAAVEGGSRRRRRRRGGGAGRAAEAVAQDAGQTVSAPPGRRRSRRGRGGGGGGAGGGGSAGAPGPNTAGPAIGRADSQPAGGAARQPGGGRRRRGRRGRGGGGDRPSG